MPCIAVRHELANRYRDCFFFGKYFAVKPDNADSIAPLRESLETMISQLPEVLSLNCNILVDVSLTADLALDGRAIPSLICSLGDPFIRVSR